MGYRRFKFLFCSSFAPIHPGLGKGMGVILLSPTGGFKVALNDQTKGGMMFFKRQNTHTCTSVVSQLRRLLTPSYFYPWLLIAVTRVHHLSPSGSLSPLTFACFSPQCNLWSSQMSRWDKWEPFPPVMAPEMGWSHSLSLSLCFFSHEGTL